MMSTGHGSGKFRVKDDAGRHIKAQRMRLGLSQTEVGALMLFASPSAGQQVVKRIEGNESTLEHVMNCAAALGLSLDVVIEWTSERSA